MAFKEKNPAFIEDVSTRFEGNVSIVTHPNDATYYGDGSLEIGGTLFTDTIGSASVSKGIIISSPFNITEINTTPELPPPGKIQLYSSASHGSRLLMTNSDGLNVDLNPLKQKGDVMSFNQRIPIGNPGEILVVDEESNFKYNNILKNNGVLTVQSDLLVNYLHLTSQNQKVIGQQTLLIDTINRSDNAFTHSTPDSFTITESGNYLFTFDTTLLSSETSGEIKVFMQYKETSVYIDIQSTVVYCGHGNNSVSFTFTKNVLSGTVFKLVIITSTEVQINTLNLICCSTNATGIEGIEELTTKSNQQDTLDQGVLTFQSTEKRQIWARVNFQNINTEEFSEASFKIIIVHNGVEKSESVKKVYVTGANYTINTTFSGIFSSGDTLRLVFEPLSQSFTNQRLQCYLTFLSTHNLFNTLSPNLQPFSTGQIVETVKFPGIYKVGQNGTYFVNLLCDKFASIHVDNGSGFKLLISSNIMTCKTNLVYFDKNSLIKLKSNSFSFLNLSIFSIGKEELLDLKVPGSTYGSYFSNTIDPTLKISTCTIEGVSRLSLPVCYLSSTSKFTVQWGFDWNLVKPGDVLYANLVINSVIIDKWINKPSSTFDFQKFSSSTPLILENSGPINASICTRLSNSDFNALYTKNVYISITKTG